MTDTPNLGMTLVEAAQSQKHVTVNEALLRIDALAQLTILDRDLTSPPVSPVDGDTYIVAAGAVGTWAGQDNNIAVLFSGGWVFLTPKEGWKGFIVDESIDSIWNGSSWTTVTVSTTPQVVSPNGAIIALGLAEQSLTMAGASVSSTIFFPNRSIIQAVSVYVVSDITGATSYDCGLLLGENQFGGSLGIASGSNNVGVIGPTAVYADTTITLTANGGSFTGGEVRVALQYLQATAPTS